MCAHPLDFSSITVSFAHQHVHTSFGLFVHNCFIRTSTCAHIFGLFISNYFICTSTCAQSFMHINMCAHIWIIHPCYFFMHIQAVHIHTLSYALQSLLYFGLFIYYIFNAHSSCAHILWIVYPCFFTYSAHISGLFIYSCSYAYQLILTFGVYMSFLGLFIHTYLLCTLISAHISIPAYKVCTLGYTHTFLIVYHPIYDSLSE